MQVIERYFNQIKLFVKGQEILPEIELKDERIFYAVLWHNEKNVRTYHKENAVV